LDRRLFHEPGPVLVVCADAMGREAEYQRPQLELLALPGQNARVDLPGLLAELARRGCNEVLVESGAALAGAFWQAGLVDELVVSTAPRLLGSNARALLQLPFDAMAQAGALQIIALRALGRDWRITAHPSRAQADRPRSGRRHPPDPHTSARIPAPWRPRPRGPRRWQ